MFTWLASRGATPDDSSAPASALYDPLRGGGGAQAFFAHSFAQVDESVKKSKKHTESAALFYGGRMLEAGEQWEGVAEINAFLRNCRQKLAEASSSCTFCVVMGNEAADLDSMASAIAYAYLLETVRPPEAELCHVPFIAIPRSDFHLRTDAAWLLQTTGVDIHAVVFADEINLLDLYARNRLQLVLVAQSLLTPAYQALQNVIVEIIDNRPAEVRYPWVTNTTMQEVGSCTTLVAEKISDTSSELLGNRALCRLLLAAIVSGTDNFDPTTAHVDIRDEIMAGLLVCGAGTLGRRRFAEQLRDKKFDQLELSTSELLRLDYKQSELGPGTVGQKGEVVHVGISVVGLSLAEMVGKDPHFSETAKAFAVSHGLHVLVVMAMYLTPGSKKSKRELALLSEYPSLVSGLSYWLQNEKQGLKLRPIVIRGVASSLRTFMQGAVAVSRKQLHPLLSSYFHKGS